MTSPTVEELRPLVAVIGAGALARQAVTIARTAGQVLGSSTVAIFDDAEIGGHWMGLAVASRARFVAWGDHARQQPPGDTAVLVGLGYHHLETRSEIIATYREHGWDVVNVVHPSATLADASVAQQHGIVVFPGAVVDYGAVLGNGCVVNVGAVICHDSMLGDSCFIGPNATICGDVRMGRESFIGAGAIVRNGVAIGPRSIVGMGAQVTRDVPEGAFVIGSPAVQVEPFEV